MFSSLKLCCCRERCITALLTGVGTAERIWANGAAVLRDLLLSSDSDLKNKMNSGIAVAEVVGMFKSFAAFYFFILLIIII